MTLVLPISKYADPLDRVSIPVFMTAAEVWWCWQGTQMLEFVRSGASMQELFQYSGGIAQT